MLSRRSLLVALTVASAILVSPALATETETYTPEAFAAAQKAGKPDPRCNPRILVSDLRGPEADPERTHGGAQVQGSDLFRR